MTLAVSSTGTPTSTDVAPVVSVVVVLTGGAALANPRPASRQTRPNQIASLLMSLVMWFRSIWCLLRRATDLLQPVQGVKRPADAALQGSRGILDLFSRAVAGVVQGVAD